MLAANIEARVREVLKKRGKGGWLRVQECAKEFARDMITGEVNKSQKTRFYRWRKKVEKGKVEGFQILKIVGNISYIGLGSSDPRALDSLLAKDKRMSQSSRGGFGFFEWLRYKDERKEKKILELRAELAAHKEIIFSGKPFTPERYEEALHKHRKKYGLE